jgi:S-DNA-T family DNA segregation ATPase FtsK/SpoIIIE
MLRVTTVLVKRLPRRPAPEIPTGELLVDPPPELPPVTSSRWQQLFQVLPMLTGTVATALMFAGRSGGTYTYVVGGIFGVSTLGMLATSWGGGGPRKAELMAARREYVRQLASLRRRVLRTAAMQRTGLFYRHPNPGQLWSTVDSYRLWERRPADADFGVVRVATGPQTLATPLVPPTTKPFEDLEPVTAGALRRFLDAYSVVPDLPVAVSLRGFSHVLVHGEHGRGMVRAILAQLAVFHAPDTVLIAVCAAPDRRTEWEWVKWLPHNRHPTRFDAAGPVRLVATAAAEFEELVAGRPRVTPGRVASTLPHVVMVVDGGEYLAGGDIDGVTVLDLDTPPPRTLERWMLALAPTGADRRLVTTSMQDEGLDEGADVGVADTLSRSEVEALARRLAPLRLSTVDSADPGDGQEPDLAELLRLGDLPEPRQRLRVPIGVGPDGKAVELDLKESALAGMGPHGLLIGATGSGKSELLRTIVLGLAAAHSSETLNFVLIDFKGGATFATLDRLPHVAAVITNLVDELPLVDRMTDAINGELVRRQELLRQAGNVASVRDYERARAGGAALVPLPSLLVVCDEFSELLSAKPDFIDLFVQIGRVGRSLGVHLLLASQRLEEGRLRGLDTHLSYRIGLRTFSALESRTVLGVPDAYELPRSPGHGYLKYGTEPLERFKAAYVSGPYHRRVSTMDSVRRVADFTTHHLPVETRPAPEPPRESLLDIFVDRLAGNGVPAHQVWLPPLSAAPDLIELLGPCEPDPARGLSVTNPALRGALQVPVGLVDKPFEQRRDALWLQLSGSAGHVAVIGGPRSGKSTLLRTFVIGLALTHTPAEAQAYCLDAGGGALAALKDLPHVGGVAGRLDTAAVRRTVAEIASLLTERERDRSGSARVGRGEAGMVAGAVPGPETFLVIDGWATIRSEYDDLEPVVVDIATRGLAYGIHVVVSTSRWLDFRPALRDLFGSRLELRLGDPADSLVSRKAAANVPERTPGRGLTPEGLHVLTALAGDELVEAIAAAWTGPHAPRVRLLPATVPYEAVEPVRDATNPLALPIGIAEADLAPVLVDLAAEPHLLLFGDVQCGKSSFLRGLAATVSRRFSPEQARLILVDYRRSLLGAVTSEHLIGYGTSREQTEELVGSVAGYMRRRLPGPEVTVEQLRDRTWWTGPDCFVLVDDYDLVATGPSNPLLPLLDHLAQARDIGLHLILARRTGGASRALYEPVVQRLRELSSPGLVMSGDRDEGPLLGSVRPAALPPGRGWLVTRKEGVRLIQLALPPPGR